MDHNINDKSNQKNDGFSNDRTNQDHNKQVPNPNEHKQGEKYRIGEDDSETQKKEITAKSENASRDDQHGKDSKDQSHKSDTDGSNKMRVDNANPDKAASNKDKEHPRNERSEGKDDSRKNEGKHDAKHEDAKPKNQEQPLEKL